ncbi:glycosyltransferase family 39 protein [Acetobacter farinalis]|uniref:Glycosyltransferase family 39 protein n=1 Tax=Acetobacter farinalis TaxID=1260984 RepID=A0ABT3Q9J0_9PROT|nr:glycosyltransferase family 39 protein [Acetobacter farinalis]MCX2561963.1 glycosyltransferase family 39 protein [Acetobacter farinalis]NHO30552.1 hypothetical protein [Acetobacter farinalis]
MERRLSQTADARAGIIFSCLAFVGAILNINTSFPGYLYSDSKLILEEIQNHTYSDWHSPFYRWLWGIFTKILPGPECLTIFNIGGLWAGCLAIALLMRRKLGWAAGLFLLVPLMPGQMNMTGTVVIDTTMNVFFLAAFVFSLLAAQAEKERFRLRYVLASFLCLTATVLVRSNAIFAILPLLVVNAGLFGRYAVSGRGRLLVFGCALCGIVLAGPVLNLFFRPYHSHPIISLQIKHLQQLSYYTQSNVFPGSWSPEQTHQIIHSCDKARAWDNDSFWGHCGFIARAANQNDATRQALGHAWLKTVVSHPFGFFVSSLATYRVALFDPTRPTMLFNWDMPGLKIPWQDQEPWHSTLHALHKSYIESWFNLALGKPYVGLLLSCVGLVACFATRPRLDPYDRVFCALMVSGIIYLLTFLPMNVATEYRYYLWGLLAAELGAVYVVASSVVSFLRGAAFLNFRKNAVPPFIRGLVSVALALVFTTRLFSYPQDVRTFRIIPQAGSQTGIQYLREDIDKSWTDAFEGHVQAPGWEAKDNGYLSRGTDAPFTMTLSLPYQDAALGYSTGPDYGTFRVCEGEVCQTVDAHSATPGEQTLILPGHTPPLGTNFTLKWVSLFFGLILAIYFLVLPGILFAGRMLTHRASRHAA